jgi:hypothetical protein
MHKYFNISIYECMNIRIYECIRRWIYLILTKCINKSLFSLNKLFIFAFRMIFNEISSERWLNSMRPFRILGRNMNILIFLYQQSFIITHLNCDDDDVILILYLLYLRNFNPVLIALPFDNYWRLYYLEMDNTLTTLWRHFDNILITFW